MTHPTSTQTRTAVITGGTRGLGRALVFTFARRGYRVFATARSEQGLAALAEEAKRERLQVVPVQADVARTEDNARIVERIAEAGGRADVLVHNASLLGPLVELAKYPPNIFQDVMTANVFGPFDLTRQILPALNTGSSVVFVTSGVSLDLRERWGAYNISKIALDGLAGLWAKELVSDGIRVFVVNPGPMRTEMRAEAYPEEDPATLAPPEARTEVFVWLAEEADLSRSGQRFEADEFVPR